MTLRIYKKNENEFFKHLRLKFKFLSGCAESDGGFKKREGVKGKGLLQGEETELCERMRKKFGRGVV